MSKTWRIFFLSSILVSSPLVVAQQATPQMMNLDEIAKDLKLSSFKGKKFSRKIKVAILDNGFYGFENEKGKSLPKDTQYRPGVEGVADTLNNQGFHGLFMAQLFNQVIVKSGAEADFELHLFYAYGITKLTDAVKTIIDEKFDIVLYSQVWEYGGNGDGKGFINTLVNKVLDAGIVWVNSAGNHGRYTRLAPVDGKLDGADEWVTFKDEVKVSCALTKGEECPLRLVLSWNDFKDDPDTGTDKDLDLFLFDSKKKKIASSERQQKLLKDPSNIMASTVPRELIETNLAPGNYTVKVKIKSKNFSASQDQLRITVGGKGIDISSPSVGETLLPPADNPRVLVVGASDDIQSSRSIKNGKPDIWLRSIVRLKDGSIPFASSNAAALAAGLSVLHLGTGTDATREALIEKLKTVSRTDGAAKNKDAKIPAAKDTPAAKEAPAEKAPEQSTAEPEQKSAPAVKRSTPVRRSADVASGADSLPYMYTAVRRLLATGGAVMKRNGRFVIEVDPGAVNVSNMDDDQRVYITPKGIRFLGPEDTRNGIPEEFYEVIIEKVDK